MFVSSNGFFLVLLLAAKADICRKDSTFHLLFIMLNKKLFVVFCMIALRAVKRALEVIL